MAWNLHFRSGSFQACLAAQSAGDLANGFLWLWNTFIRWLCTLGVPLVTLCVSHAVAQYLRHDRSPVYRLVTTLLLYTCW